MGNAPSSSSQSSQKDEAPPPQQSEAVPDLPPVKNSVESQPVQSQPVQSQPVQLPQVITSPVLSEADSVATIPYKKEPRLTAWICLFATSIIALTAVVGDLKGSWSSASWVLLVTVLSVVVSFFALIGYAFVRQRFVGRIWGEGVSSFFVILFWIGGLAVAMNPSQQLATTATELGVNVVFNANLYFSSWASFACILYICGSWTMTYWTSAATIIKSITARLAKWWCLFVLSIIVLVASTQFHSSQNCPIGGTTEFSVNACISNKYALGLGAFACLVTLVVIILAQVGFIHIYVELACAFLLFIMYAAGVGIITYNQGSGISIGNLYFATWGGFLITVLLLADYLHEQLKRRAERRGSSQPKKTRRWGFAQQKAKEESEKKPKKVDKATSSQEPQQYQQQPQQYQHQPRQQPTMQRAPSRWNSIDDAEFSDARDDLELNL